MAEENTSERINIPGAMYGYEPVIFVSLYSPVFASNNEPVSSLENPKSNSFLFWYSTGAVHVMFTNC